MPELMTLAVSALASVSASVAASVLYYEWRMNSIRDKDR